MKNIHQLTRSHWECPYCGRAATLQDANINLFDYHFTPNSKRGHHTLRGILVFCPNTTCNQFTLELAVFTSPNSSPAGKWITKDVLHTWTLLPASHAKVFPDYIPPVILSDYNEACAIANLSPKASATLARRCLQGMIRDFWKISKNTLKNEIDAIEDKLDPATWEAIDSIRRIGNIGAHMEKNIDIIVEVDPEEANLLIQLIETLLTEWYVARHDRNQRMAQIKAVAAAKEAERAGGTTPPPQP
jgi:hypothetical protein